MEIPRQRRHGHGHSSAVRSIEQNDERVWVDVNVANAEKMPVDRSQILNETSCVSR